MRTETITYKIYKFDELSSEAKQKAIESFSDLNVDHEWWSFTYDDIKTIGGLCKGFSLGGDFNCDIEIDDIEETANLIIKNHSEQCETYETAQDFIKSKCELVVKYSDGINKDEVLEENQSEFDDDMEYLDSEFLNSIQQDYLKILCDEYEYLTSEEQIIECIKSNEYEFNQDGTQY